MLQQWKNNKKGISIIEILIVVAIISIAFLGFLSLTSSSLKVSISVKRYEQADDLAQEAIEAVRSFRDGTTWDIDGIGTLTSDTAYHPEQSVGDPPQWNLVLGEETINNFTRNIVFSDVMRDGNDNIVEAGGVNDLNTRKVTVTVLWEGKILEIITYLTNWN